jgi:hypothetical protein
MIAKLNKLGLALCAMYVLMAVFLLWSAYSTNGDVKGQFVLLQLPIALPLMLLDALGVSGLNWPWSVGYAIFIPLMLFVLYFIGVGITRLWKQSKLLVFIIIFMFGLIVFFWDPILKIDWFKI